MAVGQYFRGDFGDTTVEDHLRQIAKIFDGYDAHHDEFLVQSELNAKFSQYNGFDLYQKTFLRLAVGYAVREMMAPENIMRDDDCRDADKCRNALRLILKAASSHPELMQGISTELSKTAKYIRHDGSVYEIFGFKELSQYPVLSSGLSEYVSEILEHVNYIAMEFFADIVGQLNGTPYLSLVQEGHIHSYLEDTVYSAGSDEGSIAADFFKMKAIPSVWQKVEEASGDVFFAHAPELDIDADRSLGGSSYYVDYNCEHSCMTIEFNSVAEQGVQNSIDTSWIQADLDDDTHLEQSYILINHALGVLNGTRDGATTLSKAWVGHQRQHLIPLMEADVQEMMAEFALRGIAVPTMPDIKPVAGQGQLAGFNWEGHKSFHP